LSSATLITAFTWSSSITVSPMTTVCLPAFLNAAHEVSPIGGVSFNATRGDREIAARYRDLEDALFLVEGALRARELLDFRRVEDVLGGAAASTGVATNPTNVIATSFVLIRFLHLGFRVHLPTRDPPPPHRGSRAARTGPSVGSRAAAP
jgi:hypothetical protein